MRPTKPKKPLVITFRQNFKRHDARKLENIEFFSVSFDALEEQFYWLDSVSETQGTETCKAILDGFKKDLTKEESDFLGFLHSTHLMKKLCRLTIIVKADKNDYDSLVRLSQTKTELEVIIKNEKNKYSKEFLYSFFAKIFYAIATQRSELSINQLRSLGRTWVKDIQNVRVRYKKDDILFVKEILKLLEVPGRESLTLGTLRKSIEKGWDINPICVDVEEELDVSKLDYDDKKYTFFPNPVYGRIFISDLHDEHYIHGRRMSMKEYFEENIESLSPSTLVSKDLLDQIFVLYAIKKAQNGDARAYRKLFDCYRENAERIAIKIIDRQFVNKGLVRSSYDDFNNAEIQGAAQGILTYLIKGDDPTKLFELLEKSEFDPQIKLTKKLHKKVLEGYMRLLAQLVGTTQHMIDERKKFLKEIKTEMYRFRHSPDKTKSYYAFKMMSTCTHYIHVFTADTMFTTTSLDPYGALVYSPKFNKGLYYPVKGSNFTTWLFGNSERDWGGVFAQRMIDWYRSKCHKTTTDSGKEIWVPKREANSSLEDNDGGDWDDSLLDPETGEFSDILGD